MLADSAIVTIRSGRCGSFGSKAGNRRPEGISIIQDAEIAPVEQAQTRTVNFRPAGKADHLGFDSDREGRERP